MFQPVKLVYLMAHICKSFSPSRLNLLPDKRPYLIPEFERKLPEFYHYCMNNVQSFNQREHAHLEEPSCQFRALHPFSS